MSSGVRLIPWPGSGGAGMHASIGPGGHEYGGTAAPVVMGAGGHRHATAAAGTHGYYYGYGYGYGGCGGGLIHGYVPPSCRGALRCDGYAGWGGHAPAGYGGRAGVRVAAADDEQRVGVAPPPRAALTATACSRARARRCR